MLPLVWRADVIRDWNALMLDCICVDTIGPAFRAITPETPASK